MAASASNDRRPCTRRSLSSPNTAVIRVDKMTTRPRHSVHPSEWPGSAAGPGRARSCFQSKRFGFQRLPRERAGRDGAPPKAPGRPSQPPPVLAVGVGTGGHGGPRRNAARSSEPPAPRGLRGPARWKAEARPARRGSGSRSRGGAAPPARRVSRALGPHVPRGPGPAPAPTPEACTAGPAFHATRAHAPSPAWAAPRLDSNVRGTLGTAGPAAHSEAGVAGPPAPPPETGPLPRPGSAGAAGSASSWGWAQ